MIIDVDPRNREDGCEGFTELVMLELGFVKRIGVW